MDRQQTETNATGTRGALLTAAAWLALWSTGVAAWASEAISPGTQPTGKKMKPSEWIAKWYNEGQYKKIIRRVERLFHEGPPGKIATTSARVKELTGHGLVTVLVEARIKWAAESGEMGLPGEHERPEFVPRAEQAAVAALASATKDLNPVKAELRKTTLKKVEGAEQATARKEVAELVKREHARLVKAAKSATQARAIYQALAKLFAAAPETRTQALAVGFPLRQAERCEEQLKQLTAETLDDTALDGIIAAFGRSTAAEAATPRPKKAEPERVIRIPKEKKTKKSRSRKTSKKSTSGKDKDDDKGKDDGKGKDDEDNDNKKSKKKR